MEYDFNYIKIHIKKLERNAFKCFTVPWGVGQPVSGLFLNL